MDSKTIVAPMTPAGVSAVAALRVSGPAVRDVVTALFGEKACARLKAREASLGTARHLGVVIDSLLYIFFEGPNSYTGEDVLELYPHGNPLIVRDLLQAIRGVPGVRLAEPGEYTRRAFLNGKMDLAQAESVADVIHSANRAELQNAHRLLSGALSKKVATLTAQIKDISARIELDVDFAEEEADPDYATWGVKIAAIRENVESLLKSFRGSAGIRRLPLAVLYGAPNAGKSSLTNALLGEDRILVSNIPGTTRDFVEVRLFLENGEIRLVDTAGIADKATDALDALSMEKSREILAEADLKILVVDGAANDGADGCADDAENEADLVVYSKSDLCDKNSMDPLLRCAQSRMTGVGNSMDPLLRCAQSRMTSDGGDVQSRMTSVERNCMDPVGGGAPSRMTAEVDAWSLEPRASNLEPRASCLRVSAKSGEGLAELTRIMNERLFAKSNDGDDLWITSEREKACLEEALAGIDRALDLIRTNPAVELLAFEMQLVRRSLQSIVGEISSEDVLQSIFAGFCIGK